MPRIADYGLDLIVEGASDAPSEERQACLFTRRVAASMLRLDRCMDTSLTSPLPPPPPLSDVVDREREQSALRQRWKLGDLETYEMPRRTDKAQWDFEAEAAIQATTNLLRALGGDDPALRGELEQTIQELRTASTDNAAQGRRLMQRNEYKLSIQSSLITHAVMAPYAQSMGIPGLTSSSCQTLCEATSTATGASPSERCRAFGFRRAAPFSVVDKTGWCLLFQRAGACKVEDFGAALLTRHIDSESVCHQSAPGLSNPWCIGLAWTEYDDRALTHADAVEIAAQLPNALHPSPGAAGLFLPRSVLEAMFALATARKNRVMSFWAASPNNEQGDVRMHWPSENGKKFVYRKDEHRCILVSSGVGATERMCHAHPSNHSVKTLHEPPKSTGSTVSMHRFARLRPCDAKLGAGVLHVVISAA